MRASAPTRVTIGRARAFGIGLLAMGVLLGASACGSDPPATAAKPSRDDAYRVAAAATDRIMLLRAPFLKIESPPQQHPFVCDPDKTCADREGNATADLSLVGVSRAQVTKYFLENLVKSDNWHLEDVFCDESQNAYVILASKAKNGWTNRLEIVQQDSSRIKITFPAVGDEASFKIRPDGANYPSGTCPAEITAAADRARQGLPGGGTVPPDTGTPTKK